MSLSDTLAYEYFLVLNTKFPEEQTWILQCHSLSF